MEEIMDIFMRDGTHIGTAPKSVCHSSDPGFYHKPAWVWMVNSKKEVLVQKRAACKKTHPDKWDMPSAGHVTAGETPLQGAVRETFEELGLETEESEYRFIGQYIKEDAFELAQVYLLKRDAEIADLKLQAEEVADAKWVSFDEFMELFSSDAFVRYDDAYRTMVLDMLKKELNYQ